jgi:hypothetical protein
LKPDKKGYTSDLDEAGVFTSVDIEALGQLQGSTAHPRDDASVPVPTWFVPQLRMRRVAYLSDRRNKAAHSPDLMRAAISEAMRPESTGEIEWPAVGSHWLHENGHTYKVLLHTNVNSTKAKFMPTVVYVNDGGVTYSRPLSLWAGSGMKPLTEAEGALSFPPLFNRITKRGITWSTP